MERLEPTLRAFAELLVVPIEAIAALIVAVGVATTFARLVRLRGIKDLQKFLRVRLYFSRYLVLALEFQLAADILGTAVTPTWSQIGKLGAIAFIRTFLNFFLVREMRHSEEVLGEVPSRPRGDHVNPDSTP
ncbi:MAG: DUF1622 domain-containing protein [Pseudomonadota bacterium]|nr:DUF1622 domain-containing protein [Pseudomonadota bacterium]